MRPLFLLALLVIAAACSDPAGPRPSSIASIAIDSSQGPIVRSVVVTMARPAPVTLAYGAPGTPVLTLTADSSASTHRFLLPRLRASRTYTLEGHVPGADEGARTLTFGTGRLPLGVEAIQFDVTGTPTLPISLIEVVGGTDFTGLLVVEDGEVVGYQEVPGALFGMTRRANGDFVLLHPTDGLLVTRLDGSVAHRLPQPGATPYGRIHHDVTATPANTILFIANETRAVDGVEVVGEALWEWNPEAGTTVQRWSAFDHLDYATVRGARSNAGNWLHGNGIAFGPRGNVVMSLRNADRVISIAPDYSRVEWMVGGESGGLTLAPADRFLGQHYVSEPSAGRLLVYDNGYERTGTRFTRVLELAIDVQAGTATRVWEYRHSPDIYAALVGSARRLANGNTVVLFGMSPGHNESTGPITAVEVTPSGAVVWRLTPGQQLTRVYRLTPAASLVGEAPGTFQGR